MRFGGFRVLAALGAVLASTLCLACLTASASAEQSAYLRPDSDIGSGGGWTAVGATSKWSALNDVVTELQIPNAADYITNSSTGGSGTDVDLGLKSILLSGATITKAKAWFYTPNANSITARVKDASGAVLASQLFSSTGWHSFSVALNGSQTQLDGLRLNFRKESGSSARVVYAAFIKVGLELPPSQRDLYIGISANSRSGKPPGDIQDEALETGSTHLREDVEWKFVEPEDDKWAWASAMDPLFQEAAERGMSILPILNSPPCWAAPGATEFECERSYPYLDSEFAEFTAEAVSRYGPEGNFWQEHPLLDSSLAPRYFEIWNEPYVSFFVNGNVNPARYADLFTVAAKAGEAANPKARYLVEATWKVDPNETGTQINWGQAMKEHEPGLGKYVDGIAIHPYPENRDAFYEPAPGIDAAFRNTDRIYEFWRAQLGINRPIWITEMGYSSCDDDADDCVPGDTQTVREELKAEWLADLFDVVDRGNYGYVHAAYLYNLRQHLSPESPSPSSSAWFGIRDEAGLLPAWNAFSSAVAAYDGTPIPNTTITAKSLGGNGDAKFSFTVTDPTSTLECQLDSGTWSICASPKTYPGVGSGHTFRVRGTNAEATEMTPASYSW